MSTALTFRELPYARESLATVLSTTGAIGEDSVVVTDATLFYPHGGGQPGDEPGRGLPLARAEDIGHLLSVGLEAEVRDPEVDPEEVARQDGARVGAAREVAVGARRVGGRHRRRLRPEIPGLPVEFSWGT